MDAVSKTKLLDGRPGRADPTKFLHDNSMTVTVPNFPNFPNFPKAFLTEFPDSNLYELLEFSGGKFPDLIPLLTTEKQYLTS